MGIGSGLASIHVAVNPSTNTAYVVSGPTGGPSTLSVIDAGAAPVSPTGPYAIYTAGWNLIGGPAGTVETGALGALYNLPANNPSYPNYQTITPPTAPLSAAEGAWAYFPTQTTVALPTVAAQTVAVPLPAGHWVMVGDPTGQTVTLSGADATWLYNAANPASPWTITTTLNPGQGAFMYSQNGGTLTITPASQTASSRGR